MITEKDLFMYIWDPTSLNEEKFGYLETHYIKFKNEIELLISIKKEQYWDVDEEVINRILDKINNYNNVVINADED